MSKYDENIYAIISRPIIAFPEVIRHIYDTGYDDWNEMYKHIKEIKEDYYRHYNKFDDDMFYFCKGLTKANITARTIYENEELKMKGR